MLTGQLPFTGRDPLELIHSHIAKLAVPPAELDPSFPEVVSDIVMKLPSARRSRSPRSVRGTCSTGCGPARASPTSSSSDP